MSEVNSTEDQPLDLSDLLSGAHISSDLIQNLPQEKRIELIQAIAAFRLEVEQVEQYAGPIPHPSIVERYERTLSGSANRILAMAENRQAANIALEKQHQQDKVRIDLATIQGLIWNVRLGMFLLVGLALAIVLIGMRIMEQGYSGQGFAMIVGAACGIIVAYVKSVGHSRNQDRLSKNS